jgi:hypothetical protein
MTTSLGLRIGFLLLFSSVWAQGPTGRIVGTVADPTGAVMPDVKIIVSNAGTGNSRETVTDAGGPLTPAVSARATTEQTSSSACPMNTSSIPKHLRTSAANRTMALLKMSGTCYAT